LRERERERERDQLCLKERTTVSMGLISNSCYTDSIN
jgi:hypothetical protein